MNIEKAKEKLKGIDIKSFLNGMTEQSNYIVDKADEINIAIETVLSELEKKDKRLNRQFKLLQKKDKEIEELKADNSHQWEERCKLTFELEKKDKEYEELTEASKELCKTVNLMKEVINEMAKHIHLSGDYECLNKECEDDGSKDCEECIKEYFEKKEGENNDKKSR